MNFGLVGSLAHWSPSPRAALTELMRFQGLLFQGFQGLEESPVASFTVRGSMAVLGCELGLVGHVARRAWSEFVVVGASLLLQRLCGRGGRCLRVSFEHAAPAHVREYSRVLGDAPTFDAPGCSMEFDASLLDVAQPHFNQRLSEAVHVEARCALAQVGGQQRCSARVREQLADAWPDVPTMDDIAPKLGMSSRTLRRRLEQEGTAFPTLVAEAQRTRALRLLRDPHASVKEVAYALGFATPSAFHRAFKRWTGSSPSEARAATPPQDRA
jgi:AraC-like DNA-binding protein